jgi:hypothetical protein
MNCRSCFWCDVRTRAQGNCHGVPPQIFHQQWLKANGDPIPKVESRESLWTQFWPTTLTAAWPPVDPSRFGCRFHRFSIRTFLKWLWSSPAILVKDVEQNQR